MTKLTDTQIAKLEAKGFRRWTKNDMDRLYINAQSYGLEATYYNTGNVRNATFQGESISNADARRLMGSKVYVDIADGTLHVQTSYRDDEAITEIVNAIIAEALAEEEPATESATDKSEAETIREHIVAVIREQTEKRLAESKVSGKRAEVLRAKADGLVSKAMEASVETILASRGLMDANVNLVLTTVSMW